MRNPQDSPHRGGTWRRSDFLAYERKQKRQFLLIGAICVAIGLAALAVFFVRGGF